MHLSAINYFPIKSCGGIGLSEAHIGARGIEHDRWLMVTDLDGNFMTQRTVAQMALIRPNRQNNHLTLTAPNMPDLTIEVRDTGATTPVVVWRSMVEAVVQAADANEWLSKMLGQRVQLVQMAADHARAINSDYAIHPDDQVSFADGYATLLIGEQSLADLNTRLQTPVPMNRFRPNLVVAGSLPYAEDGWNRIRIGEVEFAVVKPCSRCVIITTDQDSAERNNEPMRVLSTYRQHELGVVFGQNLVHLNQGNVAVGDEVVLVSD